MEIAVVERLNVKYIVTFGNRKLGWYMDMTAVEKLDV